MVADFARSVIGSYLMPRRTMRDLLSRGLGIREIVLLIALGFLIEQALFILVSGGRPEGFEPGFSHYVSAVIRTAVTFIAFAWLIFGLGRAFGGTADLMQSSVMLAWYSVVANLLLPPALYGLLKIQSVTGGEQMTDEMARAVQGPFAIVMFIAGVWLWLLASYVTELHGFKSLMSVIAVMFGVLMVGAILFAGLLGGMAGA